MSDQRPASKPQAQRGKASSPLAGTPALALLIALAAGGLGTPALAQERTIEDCRAIEADAERLACYDTVLNAPAATEEPAAEPAAPARAAQAEPVQAETAEADPVDEFGAEKVPPASPVAQATPPARATPQPVEEAKEEEGGGRGLLSLFGAEKILDRSDNDKEELDALTAEIVSFRVQPYGELVVELDNGQVWRQLQPKRSITRSADKDSVKSVIIERAALGSYRMKVMPMDRTMKAVRVK